MVTDKQLEANCQNALQSTGPRVPGRAEAKLEDKRFMNLSGVDSWNRVGSWYDLNRGNVSPPVGPQSQRVATIPASPVSRRWRRYLRFSVRGLIVLVLVIGAGLGWTVRQAHVQRDAVAAIKSAGGSVKYDWEWRDGKPISGGEPWPSRWLASLIGIDYFGHVIEVNVSLAGKSDEVILQVARLDRLQHLDFHYPAVGDVELAHLKRLTNLKWLDLSASPVTDAELSYLKGLNNLSGLALSGTQVTDAGLVHLTGLTNLNYLDLEGLQVTSTGLEHLKGLTKLNYLHLAGTLVDDAGLVHLKGLTALSRLNLSDTQVTDAGLAQLNGLANLTVLELEDTQVTGASVNELKQALPSLDIWR